MNKKQLVISGATSGIGKATVLNLVQKGFDILLIARNRNKVETLIKELSNLSPNGKFDYVLCDLSLIKSVDAVIAEIESKVERIDVMINNAGGIFTKQAFTSEGTEATFAMNHLGPFHLTNKLLPLIKKSNGRIINLSSMAHSQAKFNINDMECKNSWSAISSYGNAKLYNIYSAKYWSDEKGITAFALHPGVVRTGFGSDYKGLMKVLLNAFKVFMISPEKGAETSIYLATTSGIENLSGEYFVKSKVKKASALANNIESRNQLIDYSKNLIEKILAT